MRKGLPFFSVRGVEQSRLLYGQKTIPNMSIHVLIGAHSSWNAHIVHCDVMFTMGKEDTTMKTDSAGLTHSMSFDMNCVSGEWKHLMHE